MVWKCPDCGFENTDDVRSCEGGCGYAKFGRLVLESEKTGKEIKVGIDTEITKYLLQSFAGEDARYASEPQFGLAKKVGVGWFITHASDAKNPTFLNGTELVSQSAIGDGDVVSIGPEKMKIRVKLEG